jgi:hypothetical protein
MNACELEIDLFCSGLRIPPHVSLEDARGIRRTRAGLGSGLELVIPTRSRLKPEIWVNAPVVESFVEASPYVLERRRKQFFIHDQRHDDRYPVRIPDQPAWYDWTTASGTVMSSVGVLQGTYLGIYVNPSCAFWSTNLECRFCTTGCNVGTNEAPHKTIDDVVETCRAAKEYSGVTFVHLNGGFQGGHGLEFVEPFVRAIKERVGLLVGVQLTPEPVLARYDRLIEAGVDHLSFCVELVDPAWFAMICPGKARTIGQALFFELIEYCASRMPRGAVSGELIAGIEPAAKTIEGIERITRAGAFPTVCVFRPTIGSLMEDWPAPKYGDMRLVMAAMYDACRRHRIPIGMAPNIEVSLVVTPDDAALLARRSVGFYAYEASRRMLRAAMTPAFRRRVQPRARTTATTEGNSAQVPREISR